jgi:hypothetical protein
MNHTPPRTTKILTLFDGYVISEPVTQVRIIWPSCNRGAHHQGHHTGKPCVHKCFLSIENGVIHLPIASKSLIIVCVIGCLVLCDY